jgi:hypothetical protein
MARAFLSQTIQGATRLRQRIVAGFPRSAYRLKSKRILNAMLGLP